MPRIAKLWPSSKTAHRAVKAVVFDMDGTLCLPQAWMFLAMREALGIQDSPIDILAYIDTLKSVEKRREAEARVANVERKAMAEMQPQPGLAKLMQFLAENNVSKNICTRNLIDPVNHLLASFVPRDHAVFDVILTRAFRPTKPHPDPLLHIARALGVHSHELVMVGDSFDDMASGRAAGCATILVKSEHNAKLLQTRPELVDAAVDDLEEIIRLLQDGFETRSV
ncbi:LAMI_0E14466g1_1 [Lachancea mirantina]|uniref:LAMI_0E14466g1_1 n=1 Tax=Lachancea mirantina TaxID=1230905 RepID=A0A1G4JRK3_9SACH|nr:LAMI_0E14466g1_1 [Lachancea mirantina]